MKSKFLTVYVSLFSLFVFFSSAIVAYDLIAMLNLPKGIISALVNYGYFLIHLGSFSFMLWNGKSLFK